MRICSESLPFILPSALGCAVATGMGALAPAAALALTTLGIGAFFRDPTRDCNAPADAALAPADGKVLTVETGEDRVGVHIAIFLSLLDVHVTRAPVAGNLLSCQRHSGGYLPAYRPAASNNARTVLRIATPLGEIELALIAGLIARRVVPWVAAPTALDRGQRLAIIRFGSRAELSLPSDYRPVVAVGDRVRAGQTVVARVAGRSGQKGR